MIDVPLSAVAPGDLETESGQVLVIDDDPAVRVTLRSALQLAGFRVEEAEDGQTGIEVFRKLNPDVVMLDVMMPGLGGLEICRAIRAMPDGKTTPIIMLAGVDEIPAINEAFDAGATTFFDKPINDLLLGQKLRFIIRAHRDHDRMRDSEARLAEALRIANLGRWEWHRSSNAVTFCERLRETIGLPRDVAAMSFTAFLDLLPKRERIDVEQKILRSLRRGSGFRLEHRLPNGGDRERVVLQEAEIQRDCNGRAIRIVGVVQDITDRQGIGAKTHFLSYFDPATGLPGLRLLKNLLGHAIASPSGHQRSPAVLHIDIDYFKRITETFGYDVGDSVLREVADRLVHTIGDSAVSTEATSSPDGAGDSTVTRFGGDEFAVVLTHIPTPESAAAIAHRIARALAAPIRIGGRDTTITASIGIATFPNDGRDVEDLLNNAVTATHRAKKQGRNCHQFYSPNLIGRSIRKSYLEFDLRKAIENNEFTIYYQPKLDIRRGSIVGMEALARWRHASGDLIAPMEFLAVAEETGLIVPIGDWVMRTACAQAQAWRRSSLPALPVSVNLSATQFRQRSLVKRVANLLNECGLEPKHLMLEVTESTLIDDVDLSADVLTALRDLGVRVAIDDFGTGDTSLNVLRHLPVSDLKIDRSFVRNVPSDAHDVALVSATIALAHSLQLRAVAEGVETREQADYLRGIGCDEVQGFYISRPLAADAFETWLRGSSFGEAA